MAIPASCSRVMAYLRTHSNTGYSSMAQTYGGDSRGLQLGRLRDRRTEPTFTQTVSSINDWILAFGRCCCC